MKSFTSPGCATASRNRRSVFNLIGRFLFIVLFFTIAVSSQAQTTINVPADQLTIQAAVTAASAGDIIVVAPGTYNETVTINKSIHLKGQAGQIDATFIMPPAGLPAADNPLSSIVIVSGSGVNAEISGLTVKGPGPTGCSSMGRGIFVRDGATANIHDNKILDIRDNATPLSGCQNGIAIQIGRNAWTTSGTATIANNIITGYQKGGIVVDNSGSSATINGNTITGIGTTDITAQNGIQISRGATATLFNNTVSGNSYHAGTQWDWGASGILLYQSGAVSLTGGNNLFGNDQNYYATEVTGSLSIGEETFGPLSAAPVTKGYHVAIDGAYNLDLSACTINGVSPASATLTQLFDIEDRIWHKTDDPALGFVTVKTGNVYVTPSETDAHIQNGIDAASAGDVVHVRAGNYGIETAANRTVYGNGPHQFGLYIDKNNLTVRGYKSADGPVANASEASVEFQTGSTANFGPSGIFVQANGVTLEGLKVGDNIVTGNVSSNKTIEVIGDAFTMTKCFINTSSDEGAFYMGRWDAAHPISSFSITNNTFNNALVSINNGVGITGPVAGRVITGNTFTGVATPYLIGFRGWNGANPAQGWIVDPVGGAVVTGNTFSNTGVDKYIVARGNTGGYDNSQLNWSEMWTSNTYGNHVVTLSDESSFNVRTYTDATNYPETRRISPKIQENVTIGQNNDLVLVSSGTYNENITISKSVELRGPNNNISPVTGARVAEAIIDGGNYGFRIAATNVKIDGFKIINCGGTDDAAIVNYGTSNNTQILNNIISGNRVGILEPGTNWAIKNNLIASNNLSTTGPVAGAGIYTDYLTDGMVIENNKFENHLNNNPVIFGATVAANHKNLLFKNNILGVEKYGVYCVGLDNSQFTGNSFTMNATDPAGTTCLTFGGACDNNKVENNFFIGTHRGLRVVDHGYALGDNSAISVTNNSFSGFSEFAIGNLSGYSGAVTANCNWWGTADETQIPLKISGNVIYCPWLANGNDNSTDPGFQPEPNTCTGAIGNLLVTNTNTGETFCSIQAAIDDINTEHGHIIKISSGVYNENIDALTVSKDINFAPGNSPGCVTSTGLSLNSGDGLNMEVNNTTACTGYDQFIVNGTVALGNASLNMTLGYTPAPGDQYILIDNDGTDAVTGQFLQGNSFTVGSDIFTISYAGGDGNDVVITYCGGSRVHNTTQSTNYCTIQSAIDAAAPGDVITVDAGTYVEDIVVNKSLDIRGPNYNISPITGARVPEAVILPPVNNTTNGTQVTVAAANVVFKGFTVDGDNPAISGGTVQNGADMNTVVGIGNGDWFSNSPAFDGYAGMLVENNIVKNVVDVAIVGEGKSSITGNNIKSNLVDNSGWWGIVVADNYYSNIQDNKVTRCWSGIQTNNFHLAGNPSVISGNTVQYYKRGIFYNLHYGSSTPFTVTNNTLTVETGSLVVTADNAGMYLVSQQIPYNATISNNTINAGKFGVFVQNTVPGAMTYSGGEINGGEYGVYISTVSAPTSGWGDANAHISMSNVKIEGTGLAGVYANGSKVGFSATSDVANCQISGYASGVKIENISGSISGGSLTGNTISASAVGINVDGTVASATNSLAISNNQVTLTSQLAGSTPTVGIALSNVSGTAAATVSGNTVTNPYYGYTVYALNTSPKTTITGGTITGVLQGVSAFNWNNSVRAASTFGVSNMAISGFAGTGSFHAGIYVYTGGAVANTSVTATIDKVSVTGTGKTQSDCAGLSFADFSTLASAGQNIIVTECTLTDNLNRGINIRGLNANVEVAASTLSGNGKDPYGLGGNDGFGIIVRQGATANVHNNFITNPASVAGGYQVTALYTDPGNAANATMQAHENSLGQGGNATSKLAGNSGGTLNATCNWWGSNNPATIATNITGVVTYSPLLTNGTDADAVAAGFQNTSCKAVVYANPALVDITITPQTSCTPVDPNKIPSGLDNEVSVRLVNHSQTNDIPGGTTTVTVDLGADLVLKTGFDLATAPLSSIFDWSYDNVSHIITGVQKNTAIIPFDFDANAVFMTTATTGVGVQKFIKADFVVTNQSPDNFLVDDNPNDNNAKSYYTVLAPLTITFVTKTDVNCNGASTGSITVSAGGGATPYEFSINGGTWVAANGTGGVEHTFSSLAAGTYTIKVKDLVCEETTLSPDVTIAQTAAITANGTVTSNYNGSHLSCATSQDGEITVTASGGTAPYSYTLSGGTLASPVTNATGVFSGLGAGTYSFSVTDVNSCTPSTGTVIISAPTAITGSGAVTSSYNGSQLSCATSQDGVITVTASGGTGTLTYSINGGTYQGSNVFNGLGAGTYTLSVKDANGCTFAPASVTITAPAALNVTATGTNVTCYAAGNGTATANATGGTGAYTYSWAASNGGQIPSGQGSGQTLTGLVPGTYYVSVSDANNCGPVTSNSVVITQPNAITSQLGPSFVVTNITCNGSNNGAINLSIAIQGGTAPYNYSYAWTGPNSFNSSQEDLIGLAPGTYTVTITVTDANACQVTFTGLAQVTEPPLLTIAVNQLTNISCAGNSSGSIGVLATGGTTPYEFSINNGNTWNTTTGSTYVFNGLAAGSYTIQVRDANGCIKSVSTQLTQPSNPDVSFGGVFDNNLFTANGEEVTIVYNISELMGKAATPATVRITKPSGFDILFDNTLNTAMGLPVDNAKWTITSTATYYEIKRNGSGGNNVIDCKEVVRIAVKLKRNTTAKKAFNLLAAFRLATGEQISANNSNSLLFTAE